PYSHLPGGHGNDSYCDETQGYGYHVPHGFPFPAFISFPQVVQVSFVTSVILTLNYQRNDAGSEASEGIPKNTILMNSPRYTQYKEPHSHHQGIASPCSNLIFLAEILRSSLNFVGSPPLS